MFYGTSCSPAGPTDTVPWTAWCRMTETGKEAVGSLWWTRNLPADLYRVSTKPKYNRVSFSCSCIWRVLVGLHKNVVRFGGKKTAKDCENWHSVVLDTLFLAFITGCVQRNGCSWCRQFYNTVAHQLVSIYPQRMRKYKGYTMYRKVQIIKKTCLPLECIEWS